MEQAERCNPVKPPADIHAGECVVVIEIVFDTVRQFCPTIGLNPGDTYRCEGRTTRDIALRRGDGAALRIDPFYASFVAIRTQSGAHSPVA